MDTFTVEWMNRLDQFDKVEITAIVTHDQGVIAPQRFSLSYDIIIDQQDMEAESQRLIDAVVADWEASQVVEVQT